MSAPDALRRAWGAVAVAPVVVALALPGAARAALGEGVQSIQGDQLRLGATRQQAAGVGLQVHTLTLADGSRIRQYVSPQGRVVAVAWSAHGKPRLDQLLGAYFQNYVDAGRQALVRQPGVRHHAVLQQGDLVVESTAHLTSHVGRAWLRSQLPAGESLDAIR